MKTPEFAYSRYKYNIADEVTIMKTQSSPVGTFQTSTLKHPVQQYTIHSDKIDSFL